MRFLCLTGVTVLTCAGALPAQAAPSNANFPVTGKIIGSCTIPATGPITFSTVVPANGKLDPALANLTWTITGLSCNSGSRISVSARALRINTPRSSLNPSQSQTINFTATATGWTTTAAVVTTNETNPLGTTSVYTGAVVNQSAPKAATVSIKVSNFAVVGTSGSSSSSAKPIDGTYSATIILNLAPAI
jgi:hypothetical protein